MFGHWSIGGVSRNGSPGPARGRNRMLGQHIPANGHLLSRVANYFRPATKRRKGVAEQGTLVLHYRGGETEHGHVGYYTAGSTLLAFGDLMGVLATITHGRESQVQTNVTRISPTGSVEIEFVIYTYGALQAAQAVLTGPLSPTELWELLKESVKTWKFLKGKPPTKTERVDAGFQISNIDGNVTVINQNVTMVINHPKAGDAVEQIFRKPMELAGVTEAEIEHKEAKESIAIDQSESEYFRDVSTERQVIENTSERALRIESVMFREKNKWSFTDGRTRFKAAILDDGFLARIDSGELFGKGDILVADVKTSQTLRRGKLVTEYAIVRVKRHQSMVEQLTLGDPAHSPQLR